MNPGPSGDAVLNEDLKVNDLQYRVIGLNSPPEVDEHYVNGRSAVVLIDVIRCTTTLTASLAVGAGYVFVHVKRDDEVAELERVRLVDPEQELVLGGEKHGKPIPGGAFGNSALDVPADLAGKNVLFYSTNLGRAYEAVTSLVSARSDVSVFVAAMSNIAVLASILAAGGYERIVLVSGGFYGRLSLEDAVAGGRLIKELGFHGEELDDGATAMTAIALEFDDDDRLVSALHHNRIGRALVHYGREPDIAAAITGRGLDPELRRAMRHTVGGLVWLAGIPALTNHTKELP